MLLVEKPFGWVLFGVLDEWPSKNLPAVDILDWCRAGRRGSIVDGGELTICLMVLLGDSHVLDGLCMMPTPPSQKGMVCLGLAMIMNFWLPARLLSLLVLLVWPCLKSTLRKIPSGRNHFRVAFSVANEKIENR
jgi:hypothetical protein